MITWQNLALLVFSYIIVPRLTFLPSQIHTLLIIIGPFVFPKVLQLFSTSRAVSQSVPVRPAPKKIQRALNLLFASVATWLVLSLPHLAPENVFMKTGSRLQIEANTLFARLGSLRELGEADEKLRERFTTLGTNKLLYLAFGPDTLLNCIWCTASDGSSDQRNYFTYGLPQLLMPHIAHLVVLGLATSSLVGPEGSRFRIHATIAGLVLMVSEAWYLGTYDITMNKRARALQDIDFVHWRLRIYRYISFAVVDGVLGAILWLTSTNRWLARPPSLAHRLEATTRVAQETVNKLRALGLVNNSVYRDPTLRRVREDYWHTEGQVMSETVQDEEVVKHINNALGKMDMKGLEGRVGEVADEIVAAIDGLRGNQVGM
ncbi:hypothetical protein P280DRAFT_467813 [Massarina eburnea CBS 473.64]|uniref:Uncharacterized protein n=1 Tax=Massarina eburnea CBS 473.64 TaxID=1395130 RepID=A0A6A6S5W3_9PLEO|nr:hypothetical protein P280DRAFT_467813 [Massarina eburnea CBS 473.64]